LSSIIFKRGEFHTFKATTKIHLGKFEMDIFEGDIVEYDGQTLKFSGETYSLGSLKAAVKLGWFVAEEDNVSTYIPKSADIKIRPATSADGKRGEPMSVQSVSDEEKVVGRVGEKAVKRTTTTHTDDAVSVGKIKTAAKQSTTLTSASQIASEINKLDNTPPPKVELNNPKTATGDVSEPLTGEDLVELLPDAAKAKTTKKKATKKTTKASNEKIVKTPIGNITWNLGQHWTKRAKIIVEEYSSNPKVLEALLAVESNGVKQRVERTLRDQRTKAG